MTTLMHPSYDLIHYFNWLMNTAMQKAPVSPPFQFLASLYFIYLFITLHSQTRAKLLSDFPYAFTPCVDNRCCSIKGKTFRSKEMLLRMLTSGQGRGTQIASCLLRSRGRRQAILKSKFKDVMTFSSQKHFSSTQLPSIQLEVSPDDPLVLFNHEINKEIIAKALSDCPNSPHDSVETATIPSSPVRKPYPEGGKRWVR
ncbi:hypothetical protein JOM56_006016 [Amanita muscaria]